MCLLTLQSKPLTAKKDIPIYKLLRIEGGNLLPLYEFHAGSNQTYLLSVVSKTTLSFNKDICPSDSEEQNAWSEEYPNSYRLRDIPKIKAIGQGFHSALTIDRLDLNYFRRNFGTNYKLFKGFIPKGSKYYLGKTDLVASNQIVITGEI